MTPRAKGAVPTRALHVGAVRLAAWGIGAVLVAAALGASAWAVFQEDALVGGDVAEAWGGGELGRRLRLVEEALPDLRERGWERIAVVRTAGSNPMIGLLQQRLYPAVVVPTYQGQANLERGLKAARAMGADGLVRLTKDGRVEVVAVDAGGEASGNGSSGNESSGKEASGGGSSNNGASEISDPAAGGER